MALYSFLFSTVLYYDCSLVKEWNDFTFSCCSRLIANQEPSLRHCVNHGCGYHAFSNNTRMKRTQVVWRVEISTWLANSIFFVLFINQFHLLTFLWLFACKLTSDLICLLLPSLLPHHFTDNHLIHWLIIIFINYYQFSFVWLHLCQINLLHQTSSCHLGC